MSTCLSVASWSNLQRILDFLSLRNLLSNELFLKLSFKLFYILSTSIIFSFLSWLTMTEILSSINFSNKLVPFLYSSKLF